MSEYITTGISEFDINKFVKPINRRCFNKPYGGLWGCRYEPENEYVSSWVEWCIGENFDADLKTGIIYSLKDDNRKYTINSYGNLKAIVNKYPLRDEAIPKGMFNPVMDYEAIQNKYDVIELTYQGQCTTRLSHPHSLYGWDVACILILNPDIITNVRPWHE